MIRRGIVLLVPLVLVIGTSTPLVHGEVSVHERSSGPELLFIFGKQSEPDPWPQFALVLQTPSQFALNPDGDLRGDKDPDMILRLGVAPAAVWSYWDGSDFEIAYSEWTGSSWTPTLLLTDNAADDREPKITLDSSGLPVLSWWRTGAPTEVFSTRRHSDGSWEAESRVSQTGQAARMPAVAIPPDGQVRVCYEAAGGSQRLVVVARDQRSSLEIPPNYQPEIVATTPFSGDTAPVVQTRGSKTWVSWVHNSSQVGWSELQNGSWTVPSFEPYSGPDDIEAARFRIKNRLGI